MPSVSPRQVCGLVLHNTMEPSLVWSEELVFRLIHLYREQRHLWDPKHEEYKNRTARIETLTAMADSLQVDRRELERKLKNVTCHYYKEKRKEKTKKTGAGQYRSKWFAYQHLYFLKNKKTPSESDDTSQHYEQYPCLWNKYHPSFKHRSTRDMAELALLEMVPGISNVIHLRRKIRNIRCTYNQELSKMRASDNEHKPRLAWFQAAHSFLKVNFENPPPNPDPLECEWRGESPGSAQTSNEEVDHMHSEHVSSIPWMSFPSSNGSGSAVTVTRITKKRPLSHQPAKVPKLGNSSVPPRPRRQSCEQQEQQPASYEFAIFGQHVAYQLEALPLEEAVQLQAVIQNLITDTRLRCLRSRQSQVRSPDSRHCSEDVQLDEDFSESEDVPARNIERL